MIKNSILQTFFVWPAKNGIVLAPKVTGAKSASRSIDTLW